MDNKLIKLIEPEEHKDFKELMVFFAGQQKEMLMRNDIIRLYREYCDTHEKSNQFRESSSIFNFLKKNQEMFLEKDHFAVMHRYAMAKYRFYLIQQDGSYVEEIPLSGYIDAKDSFFNGQNGNSRHLHIDFMPFYDFSPSIKDTRTIGQGIRYLNRYLSSNIFSRPEQWNQKLFEFIKMHHYNGRQLLINGTIISDLDQFMVETESMLEWLETQDPLTPFSHVEARMKTSGFEVGWGNTVGRISKALQSLVDLLNEPTDRLLERFISRVPVPVISRIAIISPHGWFGQNDVLGRPDTGGQVIYILDQVRALERYMKETLRLTGLDIDPTIIVLTRLIPEAEGTTCNQRKEKIFNTENGWILRVPFRDRHYNVIKYWISRFKVWPYLETFAEDSQRELVSEFQGRPDLVIGNYSDGNLVASLLSDRFDVIQCTIAHALEKTKYLFSDLNWESMDHDYNFSIQFSADIFSMNKSDFIITSTAQEIIGTPDTMGQYESYQFFTMPGLYQVKSGINLFAPKFNVIPPGVEESLYFPYYEQERRIEQKREFWENRLFHEKSDDIFGQLDNPEKPPIFTMARFDKIKNITGLIHGFALNKQLQEKTNLIFAAGTIHVDQSKDIEERNEINRAYELIDRFNLHGKVRWLPSIEKLETGEAYRTIADHGGIFVQPALFEAFGLTVIEAMASGLPTFATKFGGPLEIIEYGKNGYLLNTSKPELIAGSLEDFFAAVEKDPGLWKKISDGGIQRVKEAFNWHNYSHRLINLTKLYGFWRYSESAKGMIEMDRYCDMIYHFLIKKRAEAMP